MRARTKQRWLSTGTGVGGMTRDKWMALRNAQRDYAPDFYVPMAVGGGNVSFGEMAQNTAQHLARGQRVIPPDSPQNHATPRAVVAAVPEGSFGTNPPAHDEMATAMATLARGKSEGGNGTQAELLQLLDEGGQEWVTRETLVRNDV